MVLMRRYEAVNERAHYERTEAELAASTRIGRQESPEMRRPGLARKLKLKGKCTKRYLLSQRFGV